MTLGELIGQRREELKLSLTDVADQTMREANRFTLTRQHVWRWENDKVVPRAAWLGPLARVLKLDADAVRAAVGDSEAGHNLGNEVVAFHAARELIPQQRWNGVLGGARRDIWLYGMAEYRYAYDDAVPNLLRDAALAGSNIKVLLLDPNFPGIDGIDADEGNPAGTLANRIHRSLMRFAEMAQATGPRMQVRTYHAAPTTSIIRGDDAMLVTPYVRYLLGRSSPTYELIKIGVRGAFDRYTEHFDHTWKNAKEYS